MNDDPIVVSTEPLSADSLVSALARHSLKLPADQVAQLDRYCQLLWDWNTKLNLTRHTDYEKFVGRDLADCLQLAAHLRQGEEVLDVGTGGGVPGMVLKIIRPDLTLTLTDSVGKKARAVESMAEQLGLDLTVYAVRAEELLEDARFDALVVRAVGPLWKLLAAFKPHWNSFRRLLVIKGPKWKEELNEASRRGLMHNLQLKTAAEYPLLGADGNSFILKIWPKHVPER
jgi:16S rRNA (guanine527-N7)-methyltransferase